MTEDYRYKTIPFEHQRSAFMLSRDAKHFAVIGEPGTGKTKIAIDTAAWQYGRGEINALLITAPNGVHAEWIRTEVPKHMPDGIRWSGLIWRAGGHKRALFKTQLAELLWYDGLAVLAVNGEALSTSAGVAIVKQFLAIRKVLWVYDESTMIKHVSSRRTKTTLRLAPHAVSRRILNGTPITKGPFDYYAQYKFLDDDFWPHGSWWSFRHHFGLWRERIARQGHRFEEMLKKEDGSPEYVNMDELRELVAPHSVFFEKSLLNLPPKVYKRRLFELSDDLQKSYDKMREEFKAELDGLEACESCNGSKIDLAGEACGECGGSGKRPMYFPLAVTRLSKLRQITSGFVHVGDDIVELEKEPSRLAVLKEAIDQTTGQAIVWCSYRREVDDVMRLLGNSAVRYDGAVDPEERTRNIDLFQTGERRFFVGTPAAGGRGLTLTAASTVYYYSNSFDLDHRVQSEDRAHRIGQDKSVLYVDIVAENTVDERILDVLKMKKNIADGLTWGRIREWLE